MGCNPSAHRDAKDEVSQSKSPSTQTRSVGEPPMSALSKEAEAVSTPAKAKQRTPPVYLGLLAVAMLLFTGAGTWACHVFVGSIKACAAVAGVGVLGFLVVLIVLVLSMYWDNWLERQMQDSFAKVDIDKSNSVNAAELYAAVLATYAGVNVYVPVYVPDFETIMDVMNRIDKDKSGDLCYEEFRQVMLIMSEQLMSRAVTQVIFTFGCPLLSGYVVGLIVPFVSLPHFIRDTIPLLVFEIMEYVPEGTVELIVSAVMMKVMPVALQAQDARAQHKARKAAAAAATKTKTS